MQNLTLPTSQTLALGNNLKSMDAIKNSANTNQSSVESNTSFEMILKKQVKANKEAMQDKTVQQKVTQKNNNQNNAINQKNPQVKGEQNNNNNKEVTNSHNDDESIDSSIAMTQMLGDAKALLEDNKIEELNSDGALLNTTNQDVSQQAATLAISPSILVPSSTNNQAQIKEIDLNGLNTEKSLLESNHNQSKSSLLASAIGEDKSNELDAKQSMDLDGKDLLKDRLIWSSVSTSKLSQNQSGDVVNKSISDNTKLLDTVSSLSIYTNPQNQSTQSNSILPMQQLGSSNQIHAYPGKTGWDQAISQKIVWMVGAAEQTATLSLNPPDLGPLQVVINVSNQMADTTFISNNAEVRQALQDGIANLREKMAESGIQLGQANVNSGGRPQQDFSNAGPNSQSLRLSELDASTSLSSTNQTTRHVQVNNGLVDTFA
jgi:flagellar hook-length control protein FliK